MGISKKINLRKLSGWGWMVIFVAVAILAFFGNRTIFYVYAGLIVPFLVFHVLAVCSRCTNVHCALNAKSLDFIFRLRSTPPGEQLDYSDIKSLWAAIPLMVIMAIPLVAVWQFNVFVFFAVLVFAAVVFLVYQRESCRFCTNNCPNNKNADYWNWKKQQRG